MEIIRKILFCGIIGFLLGLSTFLDDGLKEHWLTTCIVTSCIAMLVGIFLTLRDFRRERNPNWNAQVDEIQDHYLEKDETISETQARELATDSLVEEKSEKLSKRYMIFQGIAAICFIIGLIIKAIGCN